ncbi:MAG TPA: alkaline phosphatase family protein [Acidobacteriaceae bacterium]|nr:alkaline phosphatase family protein [Acidobacteriaceae bacterium]
MAKLSGWCWWALLIAVAGLGLGRGWAQAMGGGTTLEVTIAPKSSAVVSARVIDAAKEPAISAEERLKLIRRRIKYVFVLFQENRSFDFYFGSYPGADGLYAGPNGPYAPGQVAGFTQKIVNTDGTVGTVTPFRIPATVTDAAGKTVPLYPADIASVNHSHVSTVRKIALDANGVAQNSEYALAEEGVTLVDGKPSKVPTLERKQFGELVMSHVDCDTVPFLWRYADRFTLFDHFMDTIVGPSTPNAIAMIAGQAGETQWMLHPDEAATGGKGKGATVPMLSDPQPYWGSALDTMDRLKQPQATKPFGGVSKNLTFASLPLSFMGSEIKTTTAADYDPTFDLPDVREDIEKIAGHGVSAVNWGWYQQGYDHEVNDASAVASHDGYVAHHNAPQYFGYVANNPVATMQMHGLSDFFRDVAAKRLPRSGVFYVRGGYGNIAGWKPQDPNPKLAKVFDGNDDHPGYADSQVSEALLAEEINAIASSPYWSQSAIIITYDESDGEYDHVRPRIRSQDAAGLALAQGPRIPALVISPYAVAHGVSHVPTEHSSVIKFVDELFTLIPLADLPDEERGREIGKEKFGQENLGPADDKVPGVGDMSSAFDVLRLQGKRSPLSAAYAIIPKTEIEAFPHERGDGCRVLGITPTDSGMVNPVPKDFNPRPDSTPGIPTAGGWTP